MAPARPPEQEDARVPLKKQGVSSFVKHSCSQCLCSRITSTFFDSDAFELGNFKLYTTKIFLRRKQQFNPPRPLCLRACRALELSFFEANPSSPPVPGERDLSPPQPLPAGWDRRVVGRLESLPPQERSYSAQDASKSGQDAAESSMIASKIPVKRLSDAFNIDDAIWNPC